MCLHLTFTEENPSTLKSNNVEDIDDSYNIVQNAYP